MVYWHLSEISFTRNTSTINHQRAITWKIILTQSYVLCMCVCASLCLSVCLCLCLCLCLSLSLSPSLSHSLARSLALVLALALWLSRSLLYIIYIYYCITRPQWVNGCNTMYCIYGSCGRFWAIWGNIGSANGLWPYSTKPLPHPILTDSSGVQWHAHVGSFTGNSQKTYPSYGFEND